jgi:5-methylcytosine-specific restriction endonuclease McrA
MRALTIPTYDPKIVYQECINSIQKDCKLRARLNEVTDNIVDAAMDYEQKAKAKQLYSIPPNNCYNNEIILGSVTKEELKNVYESRMVKGSKNARDIYDSLLSQSPLGKCPFCGFGQATTLDHYLPKAKYPQFSVLPFNLVPSCKDCNKGKSTAIATTAEDQSLHPYFDHQNFIDDQWLYARVIETKPATIYFFVKAPEQWNDISKERVKAHFKAFKLDLRYPVEVAEQLACLRHSLIALYQLGGLNGIRKHLTNEAKSSGLLHRNSWQTAMFQALVESDWYCDGGFQ